MVLTLCLSSWLPGGLCFCLESAFSWIVVSEHLRLQIVAFAYFLALHCRCALGPHSSSAFFSPLPSSPPSINWKFGCLKRGRGSPSLEGCCRRSQRTCLGLGQLEGAGYWEGHWREHVDAGGYFERNHRCFGSLLAVESLLPSPLTIFAMNSESVQ